MAKASHEAGFYQYPFLLPPDMALVCKSPHDGQYYCQLHHCQRVLQSRENAYKHLKKDHGHFPREKVSLLILYVLSIGLTTTSEGFSMVSSSFSPSAGWMRGRKEGVRDKTRAKGSGIRGVITSSNMSLNQSFPPVSTDLNPPFDNGNDDD